MRWPRSARRAALCAALIARGGGAAATARRRRGPPASTADEQRRPDTGGGGGAGSGSGERGDGDGGLSVGDDDDPQSIGTVNPLESATRSATSGSIGPSGATARSPAPRRAAIRPRTTGFDIHIDTGVDNIVGNFQALLAQIANAIWQACLFVLNLVLTLLGWAFGLTPFSDRETMGSIDRGLGRFYSAFTEPWLVFAMVAIGVFGLYRGLVRREASASIAGTLASVALMIGALWILHEPRGTVGVVSDFTNDAVALGARGAAGRRLGPRGDLRRGDGAGLERHDDPGLLRCSTSPTSSGRCRSPTRSCSRRRTRRRASTPPTSRRSRRRSGSSSARHAGDDRRLQRRASRLRAGAAHQRRDLPAQLAGIAGARGALGRAHRRRALLLLLRDPGRGRRLDAAAARRPDRARPARRDLPARLARAADLRADRGRLRPRPDDAARALPAGLRRAGAARPSRSGAARSPGALVSKLVYAALLSVVLFATTVIASLADDFGDRRRLPGHGRDLVGGLPQARVADLVHVGLRRRARRRPPRRRHVRPLRGLAARPDDALAARPGGWAARAREIAGLRGDRAEATRRVAAEQLDGRAERRLDGRLEAERGIVAEQGERRSKLAALAGQHTDALKEARRRRAGGARCFRPGPSASARRRSAGRRSSAPRRSSASRAACASRSALRQPREQQARAFIGAAAEREAAERQALDARRPRRRPRADPLARSTVRSPIPATPGGSG